MVEENEKQEDETKEEVGESKDSGEGDKPKTLTLYEQTNTATKRLENANSKTEELLNRQEELYQRQKLGGKAEGGSENKEPEKTPLEAAKEYIDKNFAKFK